MMKFLLSLIIVYLLLSLYFFIMQRSMIYYPEQEFPAPNETGVDMQVIELETEDGLTLRSWWRPPEKGRPTVIYFHGNAGHIGYRAFLVKPFLEKGYGVLLLTYRGYSGNPGRPSEQGLYRDARAAMRFVESQGIPGNCMVLYGNSIGAGVAMEMATEFSIGALVLQSPFTSLPEVGQYHFPFFPVRWLMWDQFNSIRKAEKVNEPVLVIYGEADNIIPAKFGRRLFEALPQLKVEAAIPGKGHNNLFEPEIVIRFIEENIRC